MEDRINGNAFESDSTEENETIEAEQTKSDSSVTGQFQQVFEKHDIKGLYDHIDSLAEVYKPDDGEDLSQYFKAAAAASGKSAKHFKKRFNETRTTPLTGDEAVEAAREFNKKKTTAKDIVKLFARTGDLAYSDVLDLQSAIVANTSLNKTDIKNLWEDSRRQRDETGTAEDVKKKKEKKTFRDLGEEWSTPESVGLTLVETDENGRDWFCTKVKQGDYTFHEQMMTLMRPSATLKYMDQADIPEGLRITYRDADGDDKTIDLARSMVMASNVDSAVTKLHSRGVLLGHFSQTINGEFYVKKWLKCASPSDKIQIYKRPGWKGDLYLTARNETVAPIGVGHSVEIEEQLRITGHEAVGDINGWKGCAKYICELQSHPWIASILCGFAGLVIDRSERLESFLVHFGGGTTWGKSTGQELGASIHAHYSKTGGGLFMSGNMTANSAESRITKGSGAYLAFDEMHKMEAKAFQELIFLVQQGGGKGRATRTGGAAREWTWQTCVVVSGEQGVEEKLRAAGVKAAGGMGVRLVTIDFEKHNKYSTDVMAKVQGYRNHYGHAADVFARQMIDDEYSVDPSKLYEEVETIAGELAGKDAAPAIRRGAMNIAVLKIAGLIAQRAGLLPADSVKFRLDTTIKHLWEERVAETNDLTKSQDEKFLEALATNLILGRERVLYQAGFRANRHAKQEDVLGYYVNDPFGGGDETDDDRFCILKDRLAAAGDDHRATSNSAARLLKKRNLLITSRDNDNLMSGVPNETEYLKTYHIKAEVLAYADKDLIAEAEQWEAENAIRKTSPDASE